MNNILGWREWISLPDLGIDSIKAKIDTGARTSALHAFDVQLVDMQEKPIVQFKIHPKQKDLSTEILCQAPLLDERDVRDSGGHLERRYVILTHIGFGTSIIPAEVTLTNRDNMGFRMLIGRTTINGHYIVNPEKSYLMKKAKR